VASVRVCTCMRPVPFLQFGYLVGQVLEWMEGLVPPVYSGSYTNQYSDLTDAFVCSSLG